jgi:hypothetical protein
MRLQACALAPRRVFSDRPSGLSAAEIYSDGPTLDAPDFFADNPWKNTADAERKLRASLSIQ